MATNFTSTGNIEMKTFSLNALSEMFEIDRGVSVRCTREISSDQELTAGRPTFKIGTFARALEAHHLKNASNNDGGSGGDGASDTSSLTAARVRIALANAESKERVNALARGDFCDVPTALDLFGMSLTVMREILLSVPGKLADALTAYCKEDRIQIFEVLHREMIEALTALSSPASYTAAGVAFARSCDARAAPQPIADAGNGRGNGHE
jgi:hypothetical protein